MNIIYTPQGRAREYADLACNLYNGCSHGCVYCYGKRYTQETYYQDAAPKRNVIAKLRKDVMSLNGYTPEILLSFQGDVYQHAEVELGLTRQTLELFIAHDLPFTVLTKGGLRAVRDFDLLEGYDKARFGTSLVFDNDESAAEWEPNAASISERIAVLRAAKRRGIPTWVSMEPVIDPEQALHLVDIMHEIVDHWKVGKLNYHKAAYGVDWLKFRDDITKQLERYGASYYLKRSLTEL